MLYVRIKDYFLIQEFEKEMKNICFFDDIYEKYDQFDVVYEEIVDIFFEEVQCEDVVYVVLGYFFVVEKIVQLLMEWQEGENV